MARRDPLQQIDLILLTLYGFFLFLVFAWICIAGIAFQRSPAETPWLAWLVGKAPFYICITQGFFFLAATQFRAFRQRLMAADAKGKDAFIGSLILWVAAFLYGPLLVVP
jgi:hypothetical protein